MSTPSGGKRSSTRNNIKVVCRFRPLNRIELKKRSRFIALIDDAKNTDVSLKSKDGQKYNFSFDRVFGTKASQEEVYNYSAKEILDDVFAGYNGCLLAYGQTGAGKTHTMTGPSIDDQSMRGIIPRVVDRIFEHAADADECIEFSVKCSYLEIYLEKIRDLLDTSKCNLHVHEDAVTGVYVKGATEVYVTSEEEMLEVMRQGGENRAVAATGMNEGSSRSHSLFCVTVEQKNSQDDEVKCGRLYLVDLAGSEMISKTGVTGQQLEEAKQINKSLSALGNVIKALTDKKSRHVPYRDSKLTRVLQESLGGNAKTALIINCSPSSYNMAETLSTLRFGKRAKAITNKAKVNRQRTPEQMAAYILKLEAQIVKLRGEKKAAEAASELAAMETPVATAADNGATDGGGGDESKAAPAVLDVASPRPGDDGEVSALKKQAAHLSEMLRDSLGEIEQLKARLAAKTGNASVDGNGDGDGGEQDSDANGDGDADDGGASTAGDAVADAADGDGEPAGDAEASADDGGDAAEGASSPGTPTVTKRRAKKGRRLSVSQAVQFYEKKARRISEGDAEDTIGAALAANELQELSTRLEEVESDRDRLRQHTADLEMQIASMKMNMAGTPSTRDHGAPDSPAPRRDSSSAPALAVSPAARGAQPPPPPPPTPAVSTEEDRVQAAAISPDNPKRPSVAGAIPNMEVQCEVWENQRYFLGWKDRMAPGERTHWSDRNGEFHLTRDMVKLPSNEWVWLGNWTIDKSGDVDNEGWAYALTWQGLSQPREGGHRKNQFMDVVRRRRWVRTRARVAMHGASDAANQMLALNHKIAALERVNNKLAEQVFRQQDLIGDYESRVNSLLRQMAEVETHTSAGGTAFKRTIHGRGGRGRASSSTGGGSASTAAAAAAVKAVSGAGAGAGAGASTPAGTAKHRALQRVGSSTKRSPSIRLSGDNAKYLQAAADGNLHAVIPLAKKVDVNIVDQDSRNAAHHASRAGAVDVLQFLATKGIDLSGLDSNGRMPVHYAARYGRVDVIEWLEKEGCEIHAPDQHGITTLHQAALGGHKALCAWLLDHGADVEAADSSGLTARRLAQSRRDDQRWEDVYNFLGLWQEQLQAKRAAQAASDADGSGVAVVPT